MIKIIASNSDRFPVDTYCKIEKDILWGRPAEVLFAIGHAKVDFSKISIEILDEEKSKSFLGSAGVGLVGAAVLGPIGLIAGALAGGNKKTGTFGLKFRMDENEIRLVVQSSDKSELDYFKKHLFITKA